MRKLDKFIFQKYDINTLVTRRTAILTAAKAGIFTILAGRLIHLQVSNSDNYKILSDKNRITHRLLEPERGVIYDLQGKSLAVNKQKYEVVIIREETTDVVKSLRLLQNIVPSIDIDIPKISRIVKSNKKFVPIKVIEDISWEDFSKINANIHKVDGVFPQIGYKRHYPISKSLSHIIGYISPISENEKYDNPLSKLNTAKSGKLGIEKAKDVSLRGKLGSKNIEVNASGREIRELDRNSSVQGRDIQLSIDSDIQDFCYKCLKEQSGCVSVLNVNSGEYNALVSSPSYDPNIFNSSISENTWNTLLNDRYKPLINKAISNTYPPGSTIKPFVALAALETGISHEKEFICTGKHKISDTSQETGYKTFHCWKEKGHGKVNLNKAVKESCDVYFYEISRRVGINKIAEVCNRFGLGQNVFDIFTEEKKGIVPNKYWKIENIGSPWMVGETLSAGIGQGYFLTTCAQLGFAYAQLINGGKKLEPKINLGQKNNDMFAQRIISDPRHLQIIKQALIDATNLQGGTSYSSRIIGENKMAGKTGTSQVRVISLSEREEGLLRNEQLPWEKRDHGLFVGYGPIKDPKYVVSVILEHGGSGSRVAAPIAAKIFDFLFEKKLNLKRNDIFNV